MPLLYILDLAGTFFCERSKVQGFKGCILITIRHFVNVLYGKIDRFHIPANLEHGTWQLCGKIRIFYENFRAPILVFSLTLNVEP